ncbi:bifunctional hydroxymethylpyrimidine kinase/phosphomethylpyrimidine kinase [Suttonella sp. R2A3]|uniref:bifunctional hydroxymethylpyrimidine kinase/phosphomethylpyrimidine kinase n=1 Tax=Suttonella sp. R2A3 TaxID=2908648 RepID=UPI001F41A4D8|nr:bifunctional hydroxymethylpyrimidine kinase/phosphomethylpyrimidine kinase [Suttonella sp. R2A3]UJF25282.1 bifunctional hydroxymethylpyrimidine kinase/phosphomethylpyrimidine kinase [Suttonella sp. R2A3]
MSTAIALTIAGSDSGGGAGIQADLKTFSALGVFGTSAITAITAQNTLAVTAIEGISQATIRAQIDAVFADIRPQAVKIGMLGNAETINTVAEALREHQPKYIVLDPVMIAKSGDALLEQSAITALKKQLIPLASIITPNIPEAAVLLKQNIDNEADMQSAAQALLDMGCQAVLLKGGHLKDAQSRDYLTDTLTQQWFSSERHPTRNTHGTGCTLSAAIAAGLSKGLPLVEAITEAKAYIDAAIRAADSLNIGSGHGPVHHFHRWW